ncbi:MAG: CHAT domain-containing protein, partial [Leptolyngbyaceae cyanobacterium]
TYDSLGQHQQAIALYEQSLVITREIGDRAGEGDSLGNMGIAYRNLNQYQQAIALHERSLIIAREIGDRAGESVALGNLGNAYLRLSQYQQALEGYQQGLAIDQEIGNRAGEGMGLSNIGQTLLLKDKPELAIVLLKQSVNVWEAIRDDIKGLSQEQQQSFTETIANSYRTLAELLLQQDRVLEAQEVLDLLKLQELDDLKLQVRGNAETAQGLDMWPAEQDILDRYYQLIQQDPTTDFDAFITSPDIQSLVEQLRRNAQGQNLNPAQLEKLQDNLQQLGNAALLYPLVLDDRLELILVTTAGISRHTVAVDRPQLNRAILDFRADITHRHSNPIPNARRLYTWLMESIAADLEAAGADTILYAADGQLRYIPLAALHDGDQWLTQRYTINHITAASLTDFSRGEDRDLQILAGAFSDVGKTYDFTIGDKRFRFNGLEFAGVEVEAIATDIPNTQAYFDQDFSRANVEPKMGDYSIVHFATHAEFVPGLPHESFILFGNGDRVSLRDISEWSLPNTDLVVLSACRTAVSGELGGGEEILGFGYQVQRTGARAAIASLWYVDDSGTQSLMTTFYTALQNGYSETEALRQAQMALITNDFTTVNQAPRGLAIEPLSTTPSPTTPSPTTPLPTTHPYYWAPFILIGNGL